MYHLQWRSQDFTEGGAQSERRKLLIFSILNWYSLLILKCTALVWFVKMGIYHNRKRRVFKFQLWRMVPYTSPTIKLCNYLQTRYIILPWWARLLICFLPLRKLFLEEFIQRHTNSSSRISENSWWWLGGSPHTITSALAVAARYRL